MAIELKVPSAGESITEVTIVEWLKGEGASVKRDETVALLETDKANLELVAPAQGTVSRIYKKAGESAKIGEVIALVETAGAAAGAEAKAAAAPGAAKPGDGAQRAEPASRQEPARAEPPRAELPRAEPPRAEPARAEPPRAELPRAELPRAEPPKEQPSRRTPAGRRAMRESQRGPSVGLERAHEPVAQAAGVAVSTPRPEVAAPRAPMIDGREEEIVAMTPLRRRVAVRLVEAQNTAALLTTFNEVDMSQVIALRKQYQEAFTQKHGIKLGFMSFFVRAAIEALEAFPALNAQIRGTDIIYHRYYDIGVAIGGGKGLVVPILRNAERLGFAEIERAIADFSERAKASRLTVGELEGGTFTISNGGIYGSLMSTPIVSPPQSGILGMHAIQERPVARAGAIAIAPMMYVALTYDHRIVDGREAVSFLVRIKECIENPARLLLQV